MTPKEKLTAAMADLGLTVKATFFPWSKSRNYKEGGKVTERTLNWNVIVQKDGRDVLTTGYSAGIGHCPSYRANDKSVDQKDAIVFETEHGRVAGRLVASALRGLVTSAPGKSILPDSADVMSGLLADASVIDHPTFESWASDLGLDTDSRKAEATYRACLEIALQLRAAVGESGLQKLRDAAQDY